MKKLVLAVVFMLVSACATYPPSTTRSIAWEIFDRGVEYAAEGKFEQARLEFEKALKAAPFLEAAKNALKVIDHVNDKKIGKKSSLNICSFMTT